MKGRSPRPLDDGDHRLRTGVEDSGSIGEAPPPQPRGWRPGGRPAQRLPMIPPGATPTSGGKCSAIAESAQSSCHVPATRHAPRGGPTHAEGATPPCGVTPPHAFVGRARCRPLTVARVCRLPRTGAWSMLLLQEGFGDGSDHQSSSHCGMYRISSVRPPRDKVKDLGHQISLAASDRRRSLATTGADGGRVVSWTGVTSSR